MSDSLAEITALASAISAAYPGAKWAMSGTDVTTFQWLDSTPAPTLAQLQAIAAEVASATPAPTSVQVNFTTTTSLSGVYGFDPTSSQNMTAEAVYIQVTTAQGAAKFTNGQTTKPWPDTSGNLHTFTTAQFIALAEALAQFADSVVTAQQTKAAWPTGPITINA